MTEFALPDEALLRRLPLPLAQLARRAHNAQTPLERHLTAYYLWEASLKLLAMAAVVAYARQGRPEAAFTERLKNLARPALGHWWELVRVLVPYLAEHEHEPYRQLRDLLLGRTRDDLPRAAGLDAVLREVREGKATARASVRLTELFDSLVTHRNKHLGHGAVSVMPDATHRRVGAALLAGVTEILDRLDVLAGQRLLYVGDVRQSGGVWLVERLELVGETARRIASLEVPRNDLARLPDGDRVYLAPPDAAGPDALTPLHPLVVYDAEAEDVLFLNARRGKRRTEYLSYRSSRTSPRDDLDGGQLALLSQVLGMQVRPEDVDGWAARSHDAEGPVAEASPAARFLGEFELLSELGRGGMGVVYRAWQPSLGRQVAMKKLQRTGDPRAEARFNREIRALGRVEHPNLVKVFTSGSDGDQWFYAMELIEGADLATVCVELANSTASAVSEEDWTNAVSTARQRQRRQEKPLSEERPVAASEPAATAGPVSASPRPAGRAHIAQVVEVVRQVAAAAHALHEVGVIHRDVKPGNILLSAEDGRAVLMDLGLAQLIDESEGRLTRTRQFVGTLRYASPEQILSAKLDARTDVYSLGATLWELLTLRPLYGVTEQTPTPDLMYKIQTTEPEGVRQHNPRVPRDLEAVVMKCLEKDRTRRYATAAELAADLDRWQRGEPVQAQPPSLSYLLSKKLRRYRVPLSVAAGVLLAATVGIIAAFIQISVALENEKNAKQAVEREKEKVQQEQQKTAAALEKSRVAEKLALDTVKSVVNEIDAQLKDRPALQDLRKKLLKTAESGLKKVARNAETAGQIDHETIRVHIELGDIFLDLDGATADALKQYKLAHALAVKVAEVDNGSAQAYRDLAFCLRKLSDAQMQSGDTKAALGSCEESLDIAKKLAEADTGSAQAQRDLAHSFVTLAYVQMLSGYTKVALESFQQSLALFRRLAEADEGSAFAQRELAGSLGGLAHAQLESGDTKAALDSGQQSLAIYKKLAEADKGSAQAEGDVAESFDELGYAQMLSGDPKAALDSYQQALAIFKKLAAGDPGSAQAQRNLALSFERRGNAQMQSNDAKAALESYQESLAIFKKQAAGDTGSAQAEGDLARCFEKLGYVQVKSGDPKAAMDSYQESLAIFKKLAAGDTGSAKARGDLARCFASLGYLQVKSGDPKAAMDSYQESLAIFKKLAEADPSSAQAQGALSHTLYNAACVYANVSTIADADDKTKEARAGKAVALLREAQDKGYFKDKANIEHMKHDTDLDPLRPRADFKALVAELEKDAK